MLDLSMINTPMLHEQKIRRCDRQLYLSKKEFSNSKEKGYENVFNITDGFEGDTVNDPESMYHGQRMKNGWKNSGIPWTFNVDIELMRIPKE